jgi:hypothetical protein
MHPPERLRVEPVPKIVSTKESLRHAAKRGTLDGTAFFPRSSEKISEIELGEPRI